MATLGNEYEQERERRIAENRRRMQEIGVAEAARDLAQAAQPAAPERPPSRPRQSRVVPATLHTERRRSSRTEGRAQVNYRDDMFYGDVFGDRPARAPRSTPNLRALTAEEVEEIRVRHGVQALQAYEQGQEGGQEVQGAVERALAARATPRKPVDSGKGVRIQFGKVYDSKHGMTCHWCRQKTLEDHVTCTHPNCGRGRKMPTTFCASCLRNRHGEDQQAAVASGQWVCPPCRGACGPGCVSCCNCGPCRKKLDLEPTRQVLPYARSQGFSNVHDFLVHLVTGETAEVIQARKAAHPWGRWMVQEDLAASHDESGEEDAQQQQHALDSPAADGPSAVPDYAEGVAADNAGARAGDAGAEEPAPAAGVGAAQEGQPSCRDGGSGGRGNSAAANRVATDAGSGASGDQVADGAGRRGRDTGTAAAAAEAPATAAPLPEVKASKGETPEDKPGRKRQRASATTLETHREVKPKTQTVKGSKRDGRQKK